MNCNAVNRILISAIAVAACITTPLQAAEPKPRPELQTYRIDDWKAVSNSELIIITNDRKRYRAKLLSPCMGLRFTDQIAFVTRGARVIDQFAGIQLPDGSRCYFKTFEAISSPADSRRDVRPPP